MCNSRSLSLDGPSRYGVLFLINSYTNTLAADVLVRGVQTSYISTIHYSSKYILLYSIFFDTQSPDFVPINSAACVCVPSHACACA